MSTDFAELLNTSDLKTQFLRFLFKQYEHPIYGPIIGKKVFYCSIDNECKKFTLSQLKLKMSQFEEVHESYGNHFKANIPVTFHANHADNNGNGNITVRENDRYSNNSCLQC